MPCMVPPASQEEEQEMGEVDTNTMILPAAPGQQALEEALSSLRSCRARCSELLEAARRRRVTSELELRCLEFLEKELSYIIACSSMWEVDMMMLGWLHELNHITAVTLPRALDDVDPKRRRTLLRRVAVRCFPRGRPHPSRLRYEAERFYSLDQHPFRYRHHLTAISGLGLPPQVAEIMGINWSFFARLQFQYGSRQIINLPALLYMVMFPHGYKFDKDRLFNMWFCGGLFDWEGSIVPLLDGNILAHPRAGASADIYFSLLVDRNVITRAAGNSRGSNNHPDEAEAWQWNVDHSVHQLLASKSAEMGFAFTSDTLNLAAADHGNEPSRIPRRLALHHDDPNIPFLLQRIDLSQTRLLAVSGAVIGVPMHKFANLVVLDVEGWENFEDEDLQIVCRSKMFFLKHLSFRNTRVSKLPPEIKELYGLQILDGRNTQITELPLGVFVATRLCRLDLRGTLIRQVTMPKQIMGLANTLRALLLGGGEGMNNSTETEPTLPHDIRHFRHLEALATIDLREQPASFIKALGDLQYLRVLAITWSFHQSSDRDYCEALLSSLERWQRNLQSLTINCGLGCSMEFLGSLSYMSSNLKTFKVTVGRFAAVPQWFDGLEYYLSFVQITICELEARDLEILRGLRKLKCLILGLDFIPKEAIVIKNAGFLELQRFSIDCPVTWLTFESGAMPKLTYLQLNFRACPTSPISVPSGMCNLSSLAEVALWYNVRYANSSNIKITVEAVRKELKHRSTTKKIGLFINGIEQDDVQAVDEETHNATGTPSGAKDVVQVVDEIAEA